MDQEAQISKIKIYIDIHQGRVIFFTTSNIKVDSVNKGRIAELVCRANWGLLNGNFEYNYDEGDLRYKVYIGVKNGELSKDEVVYLRK